MKEVDYLAEIQEATSRYIGNLVSFGDTRLAIADSLMLYEALATAGLRLVIGDDGKPSVSLTPYTEPERVRRLGSAAARSNEKVARRA